MCDHRFALALAGALVSFTASAQFAGSVAAYTPGSGVAASFQNPSAALGAPTTFIGYQNADPFNPPYRGSDIVGIGSGGSLTLQLDTPVRNDPTHPFGLDFIVFGHAGFIITNGDYSGGGITDGTFFAGGTSTSRISVSADGVTFYTLNPSLAPNVDGLYPTDAGGNVLTPVNPALTAGSFAGQDLAGIRALYAGSAGGTGYDLSWAQDGLGHDVALSAVSFVRIDVSSGPAYLDAISVVPEPSATLLGLLGAALLAVRRTHVFS